MILIVGCSDINEPTPPAPLSGYTVDYAMPDTTLYFLMTLKEVIVWERYIDGDSSLGEPFTDVNGNGVYDEGTDIFIITNGPDNMDLNLNGRYDSPADPWEPGFPYIDRNMNGGYDLPNGQYDYGEPYVDATRDGVWSQGRLIGQVMRKVVTDSGEPIKYELIAVDSVFGILITEKMFYTSRITALHFENLPEQSISIGHEFEGDSLHFAVTLLNGCQLPIMDSTVFSNETKWVAAVPANVGETMQVERTTTLATTNNYGINYVDQTFWVQYCCARDSLGVARPDMNDLHVRYLLTEGYGIIGVDIPGELPYYAIKRFAVLPNGFVE
jgi:hypothetical protein